MEKKENETFESSVKKLEVIINELESGELDLDKSISKYTEAMKLIENLETPKNEDELYKQFRYISRIALREGIYPSAFYLLLIDEFSKLK